jgi:NADPH:quinone reductase
MKAILVQEGKLVISTYPKPEPQTGYVLVKNKAFGINRAEIYMRKGEFGDTHDIIGIEFVGTVENDPSNTFKNGQTVIAFVGGLARGFGGSYAEFVSIPIENIVPIKTSLPWEELAAIPETFATAWAVLNLGIGAKKGQPILVRGGTSTLGLAIIILAKQLKMKVLATSRSAGKFDLLKQYGADFTLLDDGKIAEKVKAILPKGVSCVADLIGNTTLPDSFNCVDIKGTVCVAGFLGGMAPFENFMPLMQIPSSIKLTSFGSAFVFGNKDFPFAGIPMQKIISAIESKKLPNILAKIFTFEQISEAHALVESNDARGKVVIMV